MNTSQIKNFAAQSRNILKAGVIQRIQILGFDVDGNLTKGEPTRIEIQGGATLFAGEIFDGSFYNRWMSLRHRIQEKGVKEVYEEAAYTWFNRLVAIRIMMKNGFIDPVLAYTNEQTRIPRIVAEARAGRVGKMSPADREKLRELMGDDARINEQFALLIDNFCRNNAVIFNCFGGIEEYISLLLPDNILAPGGFIDLLNHTSYITDEDFKQSELIGWLYQFYISEKKDEVFEGFKKGKKAEAEDIPAATQIFTPNWVVKYMVQNTIGRIYLDNNPWASSIRDDMQFLVEPSTSTQKKSFLKLEDLIDYKMIDPACGSGHILVEGFDLFYKMYVEEGFSSHQSIENIFKYNLTGIDLDTRAKQLATFALLMKAAKIDKSFLDCKVMPHVLDMPRHSYSGSLYELLREFYMGADRTVMEETVKAFELLEQADNLGSVMRFDISDKTRKEMNLRYHERVQLGNATRESDSLVEQILPSICFILTLTDKYTSVVANPPYMGLANMNDSLNAYVSANYALGKADICTVFVMKFRELCCNSGSYGFIIPPSWMFLATGEYLRKDILDNQTISSVVHLSNGVFGGDFGSTISIIQNTPPQDAKGVYFRIVEKTFQSIEQEDLKSILLETLKDKGFRFDFSSYKKGQTKIAHSAKGKQIYYPDVPQKDFYDIPGNPLGYWVGKNEKEKFTIGTVSKFARPCKGIDTGENSYFLRFWHEIDKRQIDPSEGKGKWVPYNKGGDLRKWYGNREYLLRWNGSPRELESRLTWKKKKPTLRNKDQWFKESFTWTSVTASSFSARYCPEGALFDNGGSSLFSEHNLYLIGGLINSKVANRYFDVLSPSINYQPGEIGNLPFNPSFFYQTEGSIEAINSLVESSIKISQSDWDAHETSWDFKENELVRVYKENHGDGVFMDANRFEDIVALYHDYWKEKFYLLHSNEEELNRKFIEVYGLQDELTADVQLDETTILQQGEISVEAGELVWHNDVLAKQLISYAVGCMMGRYRLDRPGLHIAYPNPSAEDIAAYDFQGEKFEIDDDGIIPLLPRDCPFDDNAYNRLVKFIRQVFGESFLNENLNFLEASLGRTLEDYFVKDFWKDHKKMYSNRPIYWLFSSKKGAFQCLTYMHRMNPYTAEAVRSKYLLPYIDFLKNKIDSYMERASSLNTSERKELEKMQKALDECLEYEEQLHDVADRQIRFDLEDGVTENYSKFGDVLAKIK